jgi:hypothetical protein
MKDKREGQRNGQTMRRHIGTKLGRELVPLLAGSYLTHRLSNVACMQMVRSNGNKRPTTSISCQSNLYVYIKGLSVFFLVMALFDWPITTKKFNLWTLPK